ncbi:MAG: pilin [Candidatus Peribacteria bacterium]|nr:pilin [Candidatus Peribacteria bacterium]
MKKTIYGFLLGVVALAGIGSVALTNVAEAQGLPGTVNDTTWANPTGDNALTDTKQTGSSLITTIKTFINWMLGMLATIALVICLYAGFLMVTAAGDDAKYKKGMSILKQAGIGLVIIGLAWMIVSVIFWLIGSMSGGTTA